MLFLFSVWCCAALPAGHTASIHTWPELALFSEGHVEAGALRHNYMCARRMDKGRDGTREGGRGLASEEHRRRLIHAYRTAILT